MEKPTEKEKKVFIAYTHLVGLSNKVSNYTGLNKSDSEVLTRVVAKSLKITPEETKNLLISAERKDQSEIISSLSCNYCKEKYFFKQSF